MLAPLAVRDSARVNSWVFLALYPASARPARRFGRVASLRPAMGESPYLLKRLDLSASTSDRCEEALPPGASPSVGARHRLESTDAPHCTLSSSEWTGQKDNRGLRGHRQRSCRLHVVGRSGGADRLGLAAHAEHLTGGVEPRQGNARQPLCGRLSADARCKIGTAPDAHSDLR